MTGKTNRALWLFLIGFFSLLFMLNFGSCYLASERTPFEYYEMSGSINVTTPLENSTHSNSDIAVNLTLRLGGYEFGSNTHYFPLQSISCVYSLDGSDWQNMTFVSAFEDEQWPSCLFWYSETWVNYTTTLQDVAEGSHYVTIEVKPDSLRTNQTLIHFNVISQPSTQLVSPLTVGVIGVIFVVTFAIASGIYVKKGRRKTPL
jgi:hypothetical protein